MQSFTGLAEPEVGGWIWGAWTGSPCAPLSALSGNVWRLQPQTGSVSSITMSSHELKHPEHTRAACLSSAPSDIPHANPMDLCSSIWEKPHPHTANNLHSQSWQRGRWSFQGHEHTRVWSSACSWSPQAGRWQQCPGASLIWGHGTRGHQTLAGPRSPTQSSLYSHRALGKAKEMSKKAIFEAILSASGLYCNAAQVPKYTMLGGM